MKPKTKKKRIPKRGKSERSKIMAKLDKLYSDYVRERDNWTCVRCGLREINNKRHMSCSHYWSRRHISTRWELDNLCTLCWNCHAYHWESEKQSDYRNYMLKKLGKEGYEKLEQKHLMTWKISTSELEFLYKVQKEEFKKLIINRKEVKYNEL